MTKLYKIIKRLTCSTIFLLGITLYGCSSTPSKSSEADTISEDTQHNTATYAEEYSNDVPDASDVSGVSDVSDVSDVSGVSDVSDISDMSDVSDVSNVPDEPDISLLLETALEPLGTTMYIWGGGWNEADDGAGEEALTIGISPRWAEFAALQDSTYDYTLTKYQIHDGLDCSGYIGWLIYNIFPNQDTGYVMKACDMAATFSGYGWGSYSPAEYVTDWKTGDIMSMSGHVWMVLTECDDGSVLLIHSSPPGVRICGTAPPDIEDSALSLPDRDYSTAEQLAAQIMSTKYPDWYSRYPNCSVSHKYLTQSSQFRWDSSTLSDTSGLQAMDEYDFTDYLLGN